jgi:mono/diheme cytochrome c family protein
MAARALLGGLAAAVHATLFACAGAPNGEAGAPATADGPPAGAATPAHAAASAAAVDPVAEATQIFSTRCSPCHGATGAGDGAASKGLVPPPRDFGDATWQGSVTDTHIEQIIQFGGAAVGKAPTMPPNPDLTSKPAVVSALRVHIRSLKH